MFAEVLFVFSVWALGFWVWVVGVPVVVGIVVGVVVGAVTVLTVLTGLTVGVVVVVMVGVRGVVGVGGGVWVWGGWGAGLDGGDADEGGAARHVLGAFSFLALAFFFLVEDGEPDAGLVHDDHGSGEHGHGEHVAGGGEDGGGGEDDDDGPRAGSAHGGGLEEAEFDHGHDDDWEFEGEAEDETEGGDEGDVLADAPAVADAETVGVFVEELEGAGDDEVEGEEDAGEEEPEADDEGGPEETAFAIGEAWEDEFEEEVEEEGEADDDACDERELHGEHEAFGGGEGLGFDHVGGDVEVWRGFGGDELGGEFEDLGAVFCGEEERGGFGEIGFAVGFREDGSGVVEEDCVGELAVEGGGGDGVEEELPLRAFEGGGAAGGVVDAPPCGLLLAFGESGDDGREIAFARGFEAGAAERVADDGEEPLVEGEAEDDPGDEGEDHPREGFAEIFEVGEERFFLVHGELVAFASDLVAELQQRGEEHGKRGGRGGAGV